MAAIKSRKTYTITPGSVAELVVSVHNLDERDAQGLIQKTEKAFLEAAADMSRLLGQREKTEQEERSERVRALMEQIDPPHKVISHGTADLPRDVEPATPAKRSKK